MVALEEGIVALTKEIYLILNIKIAHFTAGKWLVLSYFWWDERL